MNSLFKIKRIFVTILITFIVSINFSYAAVLDSLRLEKVNGQYFVLHKVNKGQTLFGTLRKYGSNLTEYKAANQNVDSDIQTGQILRIPYSRPIKETVKAKLKNDITEPTNGLVKSQAAAKTFKVELGMTLFSVAKQNSTTVAELKRLNKLENETIKAGQILIVSEVEHVNEKLRQKAEVVSKSIPDITVKTNDQIAVKNENAVVTKNAPIKDEILVQKDNTNVAVKQESMLKAAPIIKAENTAKVDDVVKTRIDTANNKPNSEINGDSQLQIIKADEVPNRVLQVEEGIAELIAVESKSGKYLALHKSAPLGTLIQVKNETNGASVWVKVIGRLPEVEQNQNVVIKLSPKAMERVSPVDKRFRAKLNYSL